MATILVIDDEQGVCDLFDRGSVEKERHHKIALCQQASAGPLASHRNSCFHSILLAILIVLGPQVVYAQTISIVNMDHSREAIVMEAVLKRLLRAEGYTIQGSSTEGYVVLLHGMAAHTTQGVSLGVVGSAAVVKVLGGASAAALLPEGSSTGNEFVETFTAVMGSPVIYLSGSTAVGRDAEQVAEILSSYVNMAVRQSPRIAQELVRALEKSAKQQEPASLSGTGR